MNSLTDDSINIKPYFSKNTNTNNNNNNNSNNNNSISNDNNITSCSYDERLLKELKLICTCICILNSHYENTPIKKGKFSYKNSDIFHISAQNIDCGYSLEPPRRGGSNEYLQSMRFCKIRKIMYTPVNPSFPI